MIQQNKTSKSLNLLLLILFIFIMGGCKNKDIKTDTDIYLLFQSDFTYIRDNFVSQNFSVINEIKSEYYSSSIPDNDYFTEKNDLYNNDPLKPKNRELLYFSKNKDIIISLNYLFSNDNLEKCFLTVDSLQPEVIKKQLNNETTQLPYFDQFVMTNRHSIILLKAIYIGNDDIDSGSDIEVEFISQVQEFIKEFTDSLKLQEEH